MLAVTHMERSVGIRELRQHLYRYLHERRGPRRAPRGAAVAAGLAYVDSSALVKLPLAEAERVALRAELSGWVGLVSSSLLEIEVLRACGRHGDAYLRRAEQAVARVALLPIDATIVAHAARLGPALRSLDAIHLATALSLGGEVGAFVVYDERLQAAATKAGLPVTAPA